VDKRSLVGKGLKKKKKKNREQHWQGRIKRNAISKEEKKQARRHLLEEEGESKRMIRGT